MQNVIDQQCQINRQLREYPTATLTLAILGTQSSGKSTLLNALAGTAFPVLNSSLTRSRCTRGVWLQHTPAPAPPSPLLPTSHLSPPAQSLNVLDTEGFDSEERSEEDRLFQKQLSLFCVVVSDVVLINIYMQEVGRYSGGHLDILEAVFKVGERLATPHPKRIIYIVRDCTDDADHGILTEQLSREIQQLAARFRNKQLKYSIEYHFMSHYVYQPELFLKEARELMRRVSVRGPSPINNYQGPDRVRYLRELWRQIKDSRNEVDLKSIDEALKNYVMQRLQGEVLGLLEGELGRMNDLAGTQSWERLTASLRTTVRDYFSERRPTHMKEKELETYCRRVFELFEPTALKHFNQVVLGRIEAELEGRVSGEIDGNRRNKRLSHLVFKRKKEVTDIYKRVIAGHSEYALLLRAFSQRMSVLINKEERNLNHLFSLFESRVEHELNCLLDSHTATLTFREEQVSSRIKALCQEYHYNEWEVDFREIWERVSYRCVEKLIPGAIEEKSLRAVKGIGLLSGDSTTAIIAFHTNIEKKALNFCRDILAFLHDDNTFTQPLSQVKELVRACLSQRLRAEQRRWKVSLTLLSTLLLLLYGEFGSLLSWTSAKKRKRKMYKRIYLWSSVAFLLFALWKEHSPRPAQFQLLQPRSESD